MLPETYQKVIVQQFGRDPHQSLKIIDVAMSQPAANELLVRNHYAGINYSDIALMMGLNPARRNLPVDFGLETLGEVVQVGSDVEGFAVGDAVLIALPGIGYQEYARIAHQLALKVPAMKPEYLGLYINGSSAKVLLDYVLDIRGDETVLITAALASMGHYLVQLAKRAGCTVIGTCSNADEVAILRELGIDYAINRAEEDVAEVLAEEFASKLDVVIDALGGSMFESALAQVTPRGRFVLLESLLEHLNEEDSTHHINLYNSLIDRSVQLIGFNFAHYAQTFTFEAQKLIDQYERGEIRTILDSNAFIGIASIPDAIAYLFTGRGRGKMLAKLVK